MTEPHPLRKKFIERLEDDFDFLLTETDQNDIALIAEDIYCASHSSAKESNDVLEDIVGIMERYPTDTYYKDCLRELREKIAKGA